MIEKFKKYVDTFEKEKNIELKYSHSLRVMNISKYISQNLGLSLNDIHVASLIGLLHDYGRFYQWSKYRTFNDSISVDHADYGVELLFEKNEIKNFYKDKKYYCVISDAIRYHNKYEIPRNVVDKLQCEIIRDADKLDLLNMFLTGEFTFKEDGIITEKVIDEFYNHKLLKHEYKQTGSDVTIGILSFIFDLNLMPSFDYLKNNDIIDKLYGKIKDKEKFEPYFKEIKKYERMK